MTYPFVVENLTSLHESKNVCPKVSDTRKSTDATISLFPSGWMVAVTLRNVDWSGEQVNVQKKSKKFFLHAGQEERMEDAIPRFVERSSSCSAVQHTFAEAHSSPQRLTRFVRTVSPGYCLC